MPATPFWKYLRVPLLFLMIILWGGNLLSQQNSAYRFTSIQSQNGLPSNNVYDIAKDHSGFIWVATGDGLCRYDSPTSNKVFRSNDPNIKDGLRSSYIWTIYPDSEGYLWIGTRYGGLSRYHIQSDQWKTFTHDSMDPTSLSHDEVLSIHEDRYGNIWIGTEDGLNLYHTDTETFSTFKANTKDPTALQGKAVLDILEDDKGWLWLATWGGGLHLLLPPQDGDLSNATFRSFKPSEVNQSLNIWTLHQDNQNRFWVGTYGDGLYLMDIPYTASDMPDFQSWEPTFIAYQEDENDPHSISNNAVKQIHQARDGSYWIGTANGLNITQKEQLNKGGNPELTFHQYHFEARNSHSIVENNIQKILEDDQGLIWIATFSGISTFNPKVHQFDIVEFPDELARAPGSQNIYVDQEGLVWLCQGEKRLIQYNSSTGQTHNIYEQYPALFSGSNFISIYEYQPDDLYIATSTGITKFNPKTLTSTLFPLPSWIQEQIQGLVVNTLFVDSKQNIWVGTSNGLVHIDQQTGIYQFFTHDPTNTKSISGNPVNALFEDSKGQLWLANFKGLNQIHINQSGDYYFKYISPIYSSKPSEFHTIRVTDIQEINGILYLGTESGLGKYNPTNNTYYQLPFDQNNFFIRSLETSQDKAVIGSTTEGIFIYRPKEEVFNIFEKKDGLSDCTYRQKSSCQDEKGNIYFASRKGITSFHPDSIIQNTKEPATYITDIRVVNAKEEQHLNSISTDRVILPHHTVYLSIQFSALNYDRPEKNQYAYMLDGFDDHWIYVNSNLPITYTNLDPGEYTFRVKASNNDGIWDQKGDAIQIKIQYAFWQTPLFTVLIALFFTSIIMLSFQYYSKNIRTRNQRLRTYNSNLSTEIIQRKKVESNLDEQKKFLDLLMNNIPQHIYWLDYKNRFLGANQSFLDAFKIDSKQALIGKKIGLVFQDQEFIQKQEELLQKAKSSHRPLLNQIISLGNKNGEKVSWMRQNYIPLKDKYGIIIGLLISSEDITSEIKTKKVLELQSKKLTEFNLELKRSNQDLEQFAYIASHDLQAPLRSIGSFASILKRSLGDSLNEGQKEYMQFIQSGAENMQALIVDLLSFSKVNSKKRQIQIVDLDLLLASIQLDLDANLKEQNATIEIKSFPSSIQADRVKLKQLLQNLISNGIKFSRADIDPVVEVSCKESDEHWTFEVKDNGIGIDTEYQGEIFKIFSRLHKSDEYQGTGIGLAVCKKIVEQHNGNIWIESEVGKGSNFIFTISKNLN